MVINVSNVTGKVLRGELCQPMDGTVVPVAVKSLKEGSCPQARRDFDKEAEMLTELRHPNIVCLIGAVMNEQPNCLVFEYMCQVRGQF